MDKKVIIPIVIILIAVIGVAYLVGFNFGKRVNQSATTQTSTQNQNIESQKVDQNQNIELQGVNQEQIGDSTLGARLITGTGKNGRTCSLIYLTKAGQESLIAFDSYDEADGALYGNLRFSPNKQFLLYEENAWECSTTYLYDLTTNHKTRLGGFINFGGTLDRNNIFQFVGSNEEYLISCGVDGMCQQSHFSVLRLKPTSDSIYFTQDVDFDGGYDEDLLRCYYNSDKQQAVLEYNGKIVKTYPLSIK
jgi:hypothetical protein